MTRRILNISPNDPRLRETFVRTQICALQKAGWEVIEAYHEPAENNAKSEWVDGIFYRPVAVSTLPVPTSPVQRVLKAVRTLVTRNSEQITDAECDRWAQLIEAVNPACILVQFGPCAGRVLRVLERSGRPWVVQFHGYDLTQRCRYWGYRLMLAKLMRSAGAAFVPSAYLEAQLRRYAGESRFSKIHRITPGYDEAVYMPLSRGLREGKRFRLVSVGRLVEVKGHMHLLEVIMNGGDDVDLYIVGEGEERSKLEARIEACGLDSRVKLLGALSAEAIQQVYAESDAFIQLSRTTKTGAKEGLGLSPIEAAASGLPVIVSDSGGLSETCRDGESGFVVPEGDIVAAAKAIRILNEDRALASRMGAAGASWVRSSFGARQQALYADSILRSLLGISR